MKHKAKLLAKHAHKEQPYAHGTHIIHLEDVVAILEPYGDLAKTLGYLHDIVEDTHITLEEVHSHFGPFIGECIHLMTDPKGNRKTRKAIAHEKLAAIPEGSPLEIVLIVKSADRLANVRNCIDTGLKDLLKMYKKEHKHFKEAAYRPGIADPIWEELDALLD